MEKDCDSPCNFQMVNVASITSQKISFKNISMYTVYLPSRVQVNTEHYLYLFLDAAAEIGGYVGILLGVSFYDLALKIKKSAIARLQAYKTTDEVMAFEKY
uniref:Uncharacterized protein n=1 Tax=Lepeophtheirus salmonis TaxID=72036 RepID=A0A0K2V2D2_LEPSM